VHKHLNLHGQFTGLLWLVLSIFICAISLRLGFGTFQTPGPGFLLFWSGVVLGILAVLLWLIDYAGKKERNKTLDLWRGLNWNKVILVFLALLVYALLLPTIGYLIMTFCLLVFLFSIIERSRWWVRAVFALITVTATYLIFYLWLEVQLPRGIF
jgi:putative tricarboxylic transport membrane protein